MIKKTNKPRGAAHIGRYILPVLVLALIFALTFNACDTGTGGSTLLSGSTGGGTETGSGDGNDETGSGGSSGTGGSGETGSGGSGGGGSGSGDDDVDATSGASQHPGGESGSSDPFPIPDPEKTFSSGFAAALNQVKSQPSGAYLVELTNSVSRGPYDMSGFNTPVTIVIDGKGNYISLAGGSSGKGSLLTIPDGVTVILKDVEFNGCDTNTASIIMVENGGTLVMKDGVEISGARRSPVSGGAVWVKSGGVFHMDGGEITDNTGVSNGGAVYMTGGSFIMRSGKIHGNQASNAGGVFLNGGGEFIMEGGEISGNTSKNYAGGVLVNGGQFTMMEGGVIKDNVCHLYGGGVFVQDGGLFECKGGKIINNITDYELYGGGGILLASKDGGGTGGVDAVSGASSGGSLSSGSTGSSPNMILSGGSISGNSAGNGKGAGIYAESGNFTLSDAPAIHDRACIQYQPQAAEHIFIAGGFTGTAVNLDLRGNQNGITAIGNWIKPVLGMKGGGSVPADIRSRFKLGTFTRYSTGTQNPVAISNYTIGADGKPKAP